MPSPPHIARPHSLPSLLLPLPTRIIPTCTLTPPSHSSHPLPLVSSFPFLTLTPPSHSSHPLPLPLICSLSFLTVTPPSHPLLPLPIRIFPPTPHILSASHSYLPSHSLPSLLPPPSQVVDQADPDLVALHCQEIGGKDFETDMPKVNEFIK